MVKTAVIGASGFVGGELLAAYRSEFPDCIGTSFSNGKPGLAHLDLREPDVKSLKLTETGHLSKLLPASAKHEEMLRDKTFPKWPAKKSWSTLPDPEREGSA